MSVFLYLLFNSVDLTALTDITINKIQRENFPNRLLTNYKIAQNDGRTQTAAFFDAQQIVVSGVVAAADQNTLDQRRNTLMQYLLAEDANLDMIVGNNVVRYKATVANVIFSEVAGGYASFDITFSTSNPVGYDPNLKTWLAAVAITTASSTKSLNSIEGSFKNLPFISVRINSGTGLTGPQSMTLTNPATGWTITISGNWTAGQLLEIDVFNQTVQVNRVNVDFTGALPYWDVGAGGTITYSDTFTTRNITLTVVGFPRYL